MGILMKTQGFKKLSRIFIRSLRDSQTRKFVRHNAVRSAKILGAGAVIGHFSGKAAGFYDSAAGLKSAGAESGGHIGQSTGMALGAGYIASKFVFRRVRGRIIRMKIK
jgi:hypothetical protein